MHSDTDSSISSHVPDEFSGCLCKMFHSLVLFPRPDWISEGCDIVIVSPWMLAGDVAVVKSSCMPACMVVVEPSWKPLVGAVFEPLISAGDGLITAGVRAEPSWITARGVIVAWPSWMSAGGVLMADGVVDSPWIPSGGVVMEEPSCIPAHGVIDPPWIPSDGVVVVEP